MDAFSLAAILTLDSSKFESGLSSSEGKFKGLGSSIASGAKNIAKALAGAQIVKEVVNFGKEAVNAGMQFDKAMSQVAATMGTTTGSIQNLRDFALDMGAKTAFSASEAAEALNYMALAGYDAEKSMKMLPTVLNLAAAGGIALASASDMVTDAASALGLSFEQTEKLVDQMAKTSSKTNTSVAQLGEAILVVGGTAKDVAGGTTELNAVLGVLADNGIKGAEGGTALRNILLALEAPTDKAAAKMAELGLQVFNAEGSIRPLPDIFGDLNSQLSTMTEGERTAVLAELFNKVDLKSVNALLGTNVERWEELLPAIENAQGAAEEMAATQLDNLAGDITLFNSALESAKIAISDVVTPALRKFVQFGTDSVSRLTNAFKEDGLAGAVREAGSIIGEIGVKIKTAFDDGMKAIGKINWSQVGTDIVTNVGTGLENLGKSISGFFVSAYKLVKDIKWADVGTAILDAITGTGSVLLGIGEKIAGFFSTALSDIQAIQWIDVATTISNSIVGSGSVLLNIGSSIVNFFTDALHRVQSIKWADISQTIKTTVTGAGTVLSGIGEGISKFFSDALALVQGISWGDIATSISSAVTGVGSVLLGIPDDIAAFFNMALETVEGISWSDIGTTIDTAVTGAGSVLSGISDAISKFFSDAKDKIAAINWTEVGSGLWTKIKNGLTGIVAWFKERFDNARDAIQNINWSELGDKIKSFITSAIEGIGGTIKGFFDSAWADIQTIDWPAVGAAIRDRIVLALSVIVTNIKDKFNTAKDRIAEIDWQEVGSSLRSKIEDGINLIKGFLKSLFNTEKGEVEGIDWKGLGESITGFIETGLQAIDGLLTGLFGDEWTNLKTDAEESWNAIKTSITTAIESVISAWNKVRTFFTETIPEEWAKFSSKAEAFFAPIKSVIDGAIRIIQTVWNAVSGLFTTDIPGAWSQLKTDADTYFGPIKSVIEGAIGGIESVWKSVSNFFTADIPSAWDTVKSKATDVFGTVKEKMSGALSWVNGLIDGIANLLGLNADKTITVTTEYRTVGTPNNEAEQAITGSKGKTNLPSLGAPTASAPATLKKGAGVMGTELVTIDAFGNLNKFASAMYGGTILRGATVFGMNDNGPMIGGEAGPEAIVGVNSLDQMIANSVQKGLSGIVAGLAQALNGEQQPIYVVLDTGELVGAIGPKIDTELGSYGDWKGGGRA